MTALARELQALLSQGVDQSLPDAEFNRLALEVVRYQMDRNAPYRAFLQARDVDPREISDWREIPPLMVTAFKWARLTTASPDEVRVEYRTSGTTQEGRSGRHLLPGTALYDASLLSNFRAHLLPDGARLPCFILGPTAAAFPHSSLGHMLSLAARELGAPGGGVFWAPEGARIEGLVHELEQACLAKQPVMLLATALGMLRLLDHLGEQGRGLPLPPGSRLMDTGGFKGRRRAIPRAELYGLYQERLGLPLRRIVNEYGMTELGSQFYDNVQRRAGAPADPESRVKEPPPWTRVTVVDPVTLAELPEGDTGLLRIFDLANLYSVASLLTEDLGVRRAAGFEILGRAEGAEPRGCSLPMES